MTIRFNYRQLLFVALLLQTNCKDKPGVSRVRDSSVAIEPIVKIPKDTSLFNRLNGYFAIDPSSGKVNSKENMDTSLTKALFKRDSSDQWFQLEYVNPIAFYKNSFGFYFIVEVGCGAGGYCGNFYLLTFDKDKVLVQTQDIGTEAGDEGFDNQFVYRRISATALETYQVKTEGGEDDDSSKAGHPDSSAKRKVLLLPPAK